MTCKGKVLHYSGQKKPQPKNEQKSCYDPGLNAVSSSQTLRLSPTCYSVSVSALLWFQVWGACVQKSIAMVWITSFRFEGSNVLETSHNQGTGRNCNLLFQTKLLVQCGQREFLFGAVPVFVRCLFGGDDTCHLFLAAVRCVAPSPAVRRQCSSSERILESLIPHPSLLAGLH